MLSSPIAPWKGAPLRVVFAAEKPLEGELALIAPDGKVAATSRDRTRRIHLISGSPKWRRRKPGLGRRSLRAKAPAECASVSREIVVHAQGANAAARRERASGPSTTRGIGRTKTCIRRGSRSCSTRPSTRPRRGRRCMRCCAIRRATSSSTIWVCARIRKGIVIQARLRRRSLLPARVFRLQDGAAVRLREMHARRRRPAAEVPAVVEHREGGAAAGAAAAGATNGQSAHWLVRRVRTRSASTANNASRKDTPQAARAACRASDIT